MSGIVAGKLAFVTGAGSGIGKAVCQVLAREGAKVIATDQNEKSVKETVAILGGSGHIALALDVSSSESINKAFAESIQHFSQPPQIVVNSAGITRDNFLLKLSVAHFEQVINVNLKGTFLVIQAAVKAMVDAGQSQGASIVNISSIVGKNGNIGQSNYSASKAGVTAMTKTAALEFGKFGVRVNAVMPGFIKSPMTDIVPDNVKQMFISRVPLGRMGTPLEIAEVVTFLSSDRSSYVNGTSIEVTGGAN